MTKPKEKPPADTKHPLVVKAYDVLNAIKNDEKANTFSSPAVIDRTRASTTCSSFLTLMLQRYEVNAVVWAALFGRNWPRARDYFNAFNRLMLGGDSAVAIEAIEEGALCAIGYDADREGMSGHCLICLDEPQLTGESRGSLRKYALKIMDSCRSSHGANDTRWKPTGATGGIGIGYMALWVDASGNVRGYSWSMESTSDVLYSNNGQSIAFANIPKDWSLRNG